MTRADHAGRRAEALWPEALDRADRALALLQRGDPERAAEQIHRAWTALLNPPRDQEPPRKAVGTRARNVRRELRHLMRAIRLHRHQAVAEAHPRLSRLSRPLAWVAAAVVVIGLAAAVNRALLTSRSGIAAGQNQPPCSITLRADSPLGMPLDRRPLPRHGLPFGRRAEVTFSATVHPLRVEVWLSNDDLYRAALLLGDRPVHTFYLGPRHLPRGLHRYRFYLPESVVDSGFDRLVITGLEGEGGYGIGPVVLENAPPPR